MTITRSHILVRTSSFGQEDMAIVGPLALQILLSPKIELARGHVSGVHDRATATHNAVHHMFGHLARRSQYEKAPGGMVSLDIRLLRALLELSRFYTYSISELAGGSHSKGSDHYRGRAFDVNVINGTRVSVTHPDYREFMNDCRQLGATLVLGPPQKDHATHVHAGWAAL
jgi:zinc D-Ala-D-Ala carboxypeptidase